MYKKNYHISESFANGAINILESICKTLNPIRGVRSIWPISGGTKPRNIFKYGSVTWRREIHGCVSQLNEGNHVSNTRKKSNRRYILINDANAFVTKRVIDPLLS